MGGFATGLLSGIRYSIRRAKHQRVLTLLPILIIAAGVAAASTMFAVLEFVLLRPLPFPEADRLVAVYAVRPEQRLNPSAAATWNRGSLSLSGWQELGEVGAFEQIGVWARLRPVWGHPAEDLVEAWFVSASLLDLLGAAPQLGRLFTAEEDKAHGTDSVLLTYECWQRRYGGRPDILGTTATFTIFVGEPQVKTIVGVLRPGFRLRGDPPEFLMPFGRRRSPTSITSPNFNVIGRLTSGVSLDLASERARLIVPRTLDTDESVSARVVGLRDDMLGDSAPPAWLLAATTGLLLLVACASVAASSLGEALARRREMALRLALGANRLSLVSQLFVEQSLKVLLAALLGSVMAVWMVRTVSVFLPVESFGTGGAVIDGSILLFGLTFAALTVLLFGVVPGVLVSDSQPSHAVADGFRNASARRPRLQRVVVAAQLALSLVLMVCATLLGQTLGTLRSQPLGFEPSNLAIVSLRVTEFPKVTVSGDQWPLFASWTHTEHLLDSLRALPGVTDAAGVRTAPFTGTPQTDPVRGITGPNQTEFDAQIQAITAGYFQTMGIRLLSGRAFQSEDRQTGPQDVEFAVVVSRELERLLGGSAVGQRISSLAMQNTFHIVGVAENVKQRGLDDQNLPTIYLLGSTYRSITNIVVRTSMAAERALPSIRHAIRERDRSALVTDVTTMEALVSETVAAERFRSTLSLMFAGASLFLAGLGVYALSLRMVTERTREFGIRAALGATPRNVAELVIRDGLYILSAALVIGVPTSIAAAYSLRSFLFGVSILSPQVLFVSALALALCAVLAVLEPARKAMRIDPVVPLRL